MIRKGNKPLEQLARRYFESEAAERKLLVTEQTICERPYNTGPLSTDCHEVWQQYKLIKHQSYTIVCDEAKDSYVLLKDGMFARVLNIVKCKNNDIRLVVKQIISADKLYDNPDSRLLNIHIGNINENNTMFSTAANNVLCKIWRVPTDTGLIMCPLLH